MSFYILNIDHLYHLILLWNKITPIFLNKNLYIIYDQSKRDDLNRIPPENENIK